jgi:hypothetical protein
MDVIIDVVVLSRQEPLNLEAPTRGRGCGGRAPWGWAGRVRARESIIRISAHVDLPPV